VSPRIDITDKGIKALDAASRGEVSRCRQPLTSGRSPRASRPRLRATQT